jgi:hypothetical protein
VSRAGRKKGIFGRVRRKRGNDTLGREPFETVRPRNLVRLPRRVPAGLNDVMSPRGTKFVVAILGMSAASITTS